MTLPTIYGHTPAITIDTRAAVYAGNSLEVLVGLPDNSIDSIVTDPPYELGFMGKTWDNSGIAYNVQLWQECLRVLKPGGHILAFGGSRTWHRLAVAIDDAGFEIRDSIAWIYGSGFPKSLDISKAIDKGTGENKQRQLKFVNWMKTTGMTANEINNIIGKADVGSHYLRLDQPAIATADLFDLLRPHLPEVPEEIERLVAERTGIEWKDYKNREVVGTHQNPAKTIYSQGENELSKDVDITAPATAEATQWQGWGTALKPAFEPVVVGRKPLIGTVAANVLTHGTGGLNIDGTRIGTSKPPATNTKFDSWRKLEGREDRQEPEQTYDSTTGRWPSNVILDETTAQLVDEQSGVSKSQAGRKQTPTIGSNSIGDYSGTDNIVGFTDTGGASRFFYVAKASKRDRNEGLDGLDKTDRGAHNQGLQNMDGGRDTFRKNFHPTVKPTSLMRQLIRLVTPPNGIVLDPFTGSGSTGKAAILENFNFVGVELTAEYLPIIEGRLQFAANTVDEQLI